MTGLRLLSPLGLFLARGRLRAYSAYPPLLLGKGMTSESKPDHVQLNAPASEGTSTPDLDLDGADVDLDEEAAGSLALTQTPPKRKGGRKPV